MSTPAIFEVIASRFQPEAAQGLNAVYQLQLTGDDGGVWHLVIQNQTCEILSGPAERPNTTITISTRDWETLLGGKLDAFGAVLSGRVKVEGDMALATRIPALFGA